MFPLPCSSSVSVGTLYGLLNPLSVQFYTYFLIGILGLWNGPIEAKCVASVTNCGLGLETAMASTVNRRWQLFTNGNYWKSFSKLFHITQSLRLVFQLNPCVFPKDLTHYVSGYSPMIEPTDCPDE